jgi:hypothetical protein
MTTSPRAYGLETTTIVDPQRAACATCIWWLPADTKDPHRQAIRHAETHIGHMTYVESSRSRQYIVREVSD